MNQNSESHPSASALEEGPGAYPLPFSAPGIELGSRLDAIPASLRFWAVEKKCAGRDWYADMVRANDRYEEWLSTQPPEDYPVPFYAQGKRISDIRDGFRNWGVHPDRSDRPWYNYFMRANARYEKHLATTGEPGEYPFPWGEYQGRAIKDVPQDMVWWALRPSNSQRTWYNSIYDANKRFLDDVYKLRSPGSEPIWFGTRCRGLRLDQAYQCENFIPWCLQRGDQGWVYRLKDLVRRLEEWRLEHPEHSGPRQRRKAPDIQDPVGEAIGPRDDSAGSAGEDDGYQEDGFVVPDTDDEDSSASEKTPVESDSGDDSPSKSSDSASSSEETSPAVRPTHKRSRANTTLSDAEDEEEEEAGKSTGRLGRKYRVLDESSQEQSPARRYSKRTH